MFSILAGSKGRNITDILGAVLLVVATEADEEAEAEVDEVAYLDTGASVTNDADVDVEDIFIEEDTEVVADGDTPVVISTMVLLAD